MKTPKFKPGDMVKVKDHNTATGLMADLIGDLEDGLVTHKRKCEIDDALMAGEAFQIHSTEDLGFDDGMGFILGWKGKPFSGVLPPEDLKPA